MTVLELMQYLQAQCFNGRGHYMVRFAEDPFETPHMHVEPFSVSGHKPAPDETGYLTLTNRDRPATIKAAA